ncbi:MAG: hypothetical protein AAGA87_02460 [Pseudomonadota bacterium]
MSTEKIHLKQWVETIFGARRLIARVFKVVSYSAVLLIASLALTGKTMALDAKFTEPFPYVAMGSDVRAVLSDMGRRMGVTVRIDPAVTGEVSTENSQGTVQTLLDETLAQTGATWWYDGVILHVEPQDGLSSSLIISQGLGIPEIEAELATLDLLDGRFPLMSTADGAVIRVIGPRGYVEQVRNLVETLIQTRRARTGTPDEVGLYVPRVFHGRVLN